jgi:hypothetical protein
VFTELGFEVVETEDLGRATLRVFR